MNIAFRFDANNEIGMGHAVRSCVIAKYFYDQGHHITIFSRESDSLKKILNDKHFSTVTVPDMSTEDERTWMVENVSSTDALILDSYEYDTQYTTALRETGVLLCCIDDNSDRVYDCDVILNQNLYAQNLKYSTLGKAPKLLLGGEYCLLREEFQNAKPIEKKEEVKSIFLCFGGSDKNNYTQKAIEMIRDIDAVSDTVLNVVLGPASKGIENSKILSYSSVNVYRNPQSISEIMRDSDMAFCSTGSMVYELSSLGIPFIATVQADNQKRMSEYLRDKLGISVFDEASMYNENEVEKSLIGLIENYDKRKQISDNIQNTVNARGVEQVYSSIIAEHNKRRGHE